MDLESRLWPPFHLFTSVHFIKTKKNIELNKNYETALAGTIMPGLDRNKTSGMLQNLNFHDKLAGKK